MKYGWEATAVVLAATMVAGATATLGIREGVFCASAASIWFVIAFVLASRPPGFPKFDFHAHTDLAEDDFLGRQESFRPLRGLQRLRVAIIASLVACGATWGLLLQSNL